MCPLRDDTEIQAMAEDRAHLPQHDPGTSRIGQLDVRLGGQQDGGVVVTAVDRDPCEVAAVTVGALGSVVLP
jgi:hypothetical protein